MPQRAAFAAGRCAPPVSVGAHVRRTLPSSGLQHLSPLAFIHQAPDLLAFSAFQRNFDQTSRTQSVRFCAAPACAYLPANPMAEWEAIVKSVVNWHVP